MITGETEALIENHLLDQYDDFFGSKKKRAERKAAREKRRLERKSPAKVQQRREKRSRFFKDVGQVYKDIGGATAIGGVVDAILMPKDVQQHTAQNNTEPVVSDYEFSVGSSQQENEKEQEKKGIPTVVYIVGGVVVVGIIGLLLMQNRRTSVIQGVAQ